MTSSGGRMDKDHKGRRQDSEIIRSEHSDPRYEAREQRYDSHEKRDGRREKSDHRPEKKDHRYDSEHRSDRRSRDDRKHRGFDDDERVDSSRREKRRSTNQEDEIRSTRHHESESRSSKGYDQDSRKHESENVSRSSRGSDHVSHTSRSSRQSDQRSSKQDIRSSDSESRRNQRRNPIDDESSSLITDMKGMSISQPAENAPQQEPRDIPPVEEPSVPKAAAKKKFASKMRSIVSAVKTAQRLEKSRHLPTDATFVPKYAKEDIVRSGHMDYNTLYATNEQETGDLTVNLINAPNDSTLQCGCENINCPFCNLMMSIGSSDTTILQ